MSSEEELYDLACQDMPVTGDEVREALDKFKRAYAHELAERQRENCEKVTCGGYEMHCRCEEQAALIDPEVPGG